MLPWSAERHAGEGWILPLSRRFALGVRGLHVDPHEPVHDWLPALRRHFLVVLRHAAAGAVADASVSVTLWYHFGFLVISTALLGFGASGVTLALWHPPARGDAAGPLAVCPGVGFRR